MGFIETLREQIEEKLKKRQDDLEIGKQKQKLIEERRQQAHKFYKESGVGNLISEFCQLLERSGRLEGHSHDNHWHFHPQIDAASEIDAVMWDTKKVGKRDGKMTYEEGTVKFIVIEVLTEGDIVFHGLKDTRVPLIDWRRDQAALENTLGEAFLNPGIYNYQDNFVYPTS